MALSSFTLPPSKREFGESGAFQVAIGSGDFGTEAAEDLGIHLLTRFHKGAAQFIGLDHLGAQFAEKMRHRAFAAAEAACKTDAQHRLYSSPHPGGTNRVGHQHGDGQRAYTAGDRGVCARKFECLRMHVSDDGRSAPGECGLTLCIPSEEAVKLFTSREAIDADINDGRSRLDHLWCDEARASNRGDENIGFASHSRRGRASSSGRW